MSINSIVSIYNQFTGDYNANLLYATSPNSASPGETLPTRLVIGNNAITVPVVTGITVTGVTIVPPSGNTILITMKGVNGDTGIPIHKTNPTFIALDVSAASFVLSVGTQIDGVRLIWS